MLPVGFNVRNVVNDVSRRGKQREQDKADRHSANGLGGEHMPDEQRYEQQRILDPLMHPDRAEPKPSQSNDFLTSKGSTWFIGSPDVARFWLPVGSARVVELSIW